MNPRIFTRILVYTLIVIGFILLSIFIPESNFWTKFIAASIGAIISVVTSKIASATDTPEENPDTREPINIQFHGELNSNRQSRFKESNVFTINKSFNKKHKSKNEWSPIVYMSMGTVAWLLIFFISASDHLIYIIDNSGSMGLCKQWDDVKKECVQERSENSKDQYPINEIISDLKSEFGKDKALGYRNMKDRKFPFWTRSTRIGLMEIGGKTSSQNPNKCQVHLLTIPGVNNHEKLTSDIQRIQANSSGVTSLIRALQKANASMNWSSGFGINIPLSKSVILLTDGVEDNCDQNLDNKTFCEAARELSPRELELQTRIYGLNFTPEDCEKFRCVGSYQAQSCVSVSSYKNFTNEVLLTSNLLSSEPTRGKPFVVYQPDYISNSTSSIVYYPRDSDFLAGVRRVIPPLIFSVTLTIAIVLSSGLRSIVASVVRATSRLGVQLTEFLGTEFESPEVNVPSMSFPAYVWLLVLLAVIALLIIIF